MRSEGWSGSWQASTSASQDASTMASQDASTGPSTSVSPPEPDAETLCEDLDLSNPSMLRDGRYDNVAACQMQALRQARPGRLVLYDRYSRWQVYADDRGRQLVRHESLVDGLGGSNDDAADEGDADGGASETCRVDREVLARCYVPSRGCLRPENWLTKCEPMTSPMPQELPELGMCRPTAGPALWLTEGETLAVTVEATCEDGRAVDPADLRFDDLPAGAKYDERTGRLQWTPLLDQAAVYDLVFRLRRNGDPGRLRIGVADAFDAPDNVAIADPRDYPFEYGLPVFFLEDPEEDEYTHREVRYAGRRYFGAKVKVRGQTSRAYPKHSYTIKFKASNLFQEPEMGGGLPDRKKIVLITTFDDNAYVRQRLAHELWGLLDPEHVSVRAYNTVVYRDGKYRGLYTVADHIDRHLMRHHGLSDEGELFKSMTHDGDFLTKGHDMLKKEGSPEQGESGWDASLLDLVDFVRDPDGQSFGERLGEFVDVRDYQNWWVFMMAAGAIDSTGKNAYHYLEPGDAVFRTIPWDFNASFGQSWATNRVQVRNNMFERNGLWRRMAEDPLLGSEMGDRMIAALRGPYALDQVLARLDAYADEVAPSAERDWRKWGAKHRGFKRFSDRETFLSPAEEVEYIRAWLTERWAFLEKNTDRLIAPESAHADEGGNASDTIDEGDAEGPKAPAFDG